MANRNSRISHPGGGRFVLLMIIIIVFLFIAVFEARRHKGAIQVVPATQPQSSQ